MTVEKLTYDELIQTPQGFLDLFYDCCRNYSEVQDAYEAAERQHMRVTGDRKYKSYQSFRGVRAKLTKNPGK